MSIIRKKIKDQKCIMCQGMGIILSHSYIDGKVHSSWKECPTCNGKKRFIEYHNIIIDDKNKIAIDADLGK